MKRIIFVRHGESEGNVSPELYMVKKDADIQLTDLGISGSKEAGEKIRALIGNEEVSVFVSPFVRTRQTFEGMRPSLNIKNKFEDFRIIEKKWEVFKDKQLMADFMKSEDFKDFFYRNNGAESQADVFNRVSHFVDGLMVKKNSEILADTVIVVSHWWAICWMVIYLKNQDIESFHDMKIKNCEPFVVEISDTIFNKK